MPQALSLSLAAAVLLAACSSLPGPTSVVTPYRIDIRQGNFVTQEMVSQLKTGMTRDQVRYVLGTPLLTDVFHADRWDYFYRFQAGRQTPEQRGLAVFFKDDKLIRFEGDISPAPTSADGQVLPEKAQQVIEISSPASTKQ